MIDDELHARLTAERYGPSLWWKAPERTLAEEVGADLRRMLLRAAEVAEAAESFEGVA